ncbi:TRAP-type C4-dicarboxylate transport system permease small subunit [Pacificibacter maritimus]|uniref:TRAP transporter small permease protein n=1 Tax=Pacificibacter maritimus TaxID=762213 RepID=A0A3N4U804_9RHOB|nr:TRAP transporter small permease subunit [Pacificibacter maritimus]RPE66572.1 TRAP-type C4-dicarboxylate transport system permease small subunit [Pacificibacter maritimus]
MKKVESFIFTLCRLGVGLSFLVLIAAVLTQVIFRTLDASPIWTEELTRYAMLYLVAFGAGLSLRSGDLVNVDIVCEALPRRWPRRLRLLSALATALLCAILIAPAWKYVSIGAFQTSPAMGLRMDLVHFSIFLLLCVLFVFAALRAYKMIFLKHDGRADAREELS